MNGHFAKRALPAMAFLLCIAPCWTSASMLGTYTFSGGDPGGDTNAPSATNLVFTPYTQVNLAPVSITDLLRISDWTTTAGLDSGEFVEFTVQPVSGYTLTLTDITFDVQRSVNKANPGEKDGPLNAQIEILQGVSLTVRGSMSFNPQGVWQTVSYDFPDFTVPEGETVALRFYGWNAGHNHGWMDFDNIVLNGSVAIIPEPSPASLTSWGVLLGFARCALRRGLGSG